MLPRILPAFLVLALLPGADLRKGFADPPAEFRSMPLWVWNDQMDVTRMKEQLRQFKQQGIGGVFIHPRPGLMTEYLGRDWFDKWSAALEEGKRLGLQVNIYDENSYPSGFSGGEVPSRAPDTASQYVQAELGVNPKSVGPPRLPTLGYAALVRDRDGKVIEARSVAKPSEVPDGATVVAFRLRRASGNPWTGGFPYVDLTNPQTAPLFLETTYEQYKKRFGAEFGKTIQWAFTDEPLLATGGAYDSAGLALPLSYHTLAEFQKRAGYDLSPQLASLFWDTGDYRKVRFDYWQTVHDLWKENFMQPMFQWCDRNKLKFTGHWMEHEWPYPWITPDDASLYAFEHAPGIDMLEGTNLRLQGKDPHMLFTIKQVASVANQLGRRAFCEAYGVAGWDSTLEHYKRFGDWLMVHGINFVDQHLAFSTIRGARKRDHPQSFTDVSAWWPDYRLHADHLGRVSYLSSNTVTRNRLLILQQTTSGFLLARRGAATPELAGMRERNAEMNQFLADRQVDYDLLDEYIAEWHGKNEGAKLRVGQSVYELLALAPDLINLRRQTLPLLERYLAAGGRVLSLSDPPAYVDGRPDARPAELARRYASQWRRVADAGALASALPARIALDAPLPLVGFSERWTPEGDRILMFANSGLERRQSRATVDGASVELWDTVTGKVEAATFIAASGRVSFDLDLPPAGFAAFVVTARTVAPRKSIALEPRPMPVVQWQARAAEPNVLVLDYCDVKTGPREYKDINTWQANWNIWQTHGFERPAWDNAVQYKTRVFDRNHFAADSGFEASFHFEVGDAAALGGLTLAVEAPELYRISLNGKPVNFTAAKTWLDPHLREAPIGALARAGENVITIVAHPFDVKMELENVYLRGAFSVVAADKGFRLMSAKPLAVGGWAKQGMPFYAATVAYEAKVDVPSGASGLRVSLKDWSGSVAEVLLDGKRAALLGWPPYEADVDAKPGAHAVTVRVVSTPRNVMGPFHHPAKPRMRAWPAAWAEFPEHQPAGAAYDVLDYGLLKTPALAAIYRGN